MKWVSEYRPGAIEEAFVSLWCRVVLFFGAMWFGLAVATTIRTGGIPEFGATLAPIFWAMLLWIFYPTYLVAIGLTIISFARMLQTESACETIACMASVAAAWAWITLTIFR